MNNWHCYICRQVYYFLNSHFQICRQVSLIFSKLAPRQKTFVSSGYWTWVLSMGESLRGKSCWEKVWTERQHSKKIVSGKDFLCIFVLWLKKFLPKTMFFTFQLLKCGWFLKVLLNDFSCICLAKELIFFPTALSYLFQKSFLKVLLKPSRYANLIFNLK